MAELSAELLIILIVIFFGLILLGIAGS